MLQKLNHLLTKAMPIITPTSVVLGVLLSEHLTPYKGFIPWIFAIMTFAGSLNSNLKSLGQVISQPLPILVGMVILHVLVPLWAWLMGHLAFTGDPLTITGLILAVVIPTGITSFIWVSIYKGNHVLALTIILIDTLLSPIIVPYSLSLLVGTMVAMDSWAIMKGLMGMIVLPSITGMALNQLSPEKSRKWGTRLSPFSKIGLGVVVMINGAVVAPHLMNINTKLITIGAMVCLISASGYLFSWFIGKLLKWEREKIVALTFCGGMRNITAGAVIALSYFPREVAIPVIIGMLFQQVLASFNGQLVTINDKKWDVGLNKKHSA